MSVPKDQCFFHTWRLWYCHLVCSSTGFNQTLVTGLLILMELYLINMS